MLTKEIAKKHINGFKRPATISIERWREMKQWATAVWDAAVMQQKWQYQLKVDNKEFYQMLCTPTGQLLISDINLLSFSINKNIQEWKNELLLLTENMLEIGEREEAMFLSNLLVQIDEEQYSVWTLKARMEIRNKDYKVASKSLIKAIGIEPGREEAYLLRAQLHTIIGWFEKAKEDYDMALLFSADQGKVLRLRAQLKWTAKEFRSAILDLKKAVKYYPQDTTLLCELAEKQMEIGSLNDSLSTVKHVLRLNPFHSNALLTKGILMKELGGEFQSKEDIHMAFLLGNAQAGRILKAYK